MATDSQQVGSGMATNSVLFMSEVSKALKLDIPEIQSELNSRLLSRSNALLNVYENQFVASLADSIQHHKSLTKEIILNQRLSDTEKSMLNQLFSPPYKLIFPRNPTDIGAHLFYRSLNEIATYRCYDLLGADQEEVPYGYDVLIKEVGASVAKIVKYERAHVHACTPNLSFDDTLRLANTANTLSRYERPVTPNEKKRRHLAKLYANDDPIYRCYNKSEHCHIRAKYLIFAHSSYDCTMTNIANMMDSANAFRAVGFIHFSPKILSNLEGGSDNGLNWRLEWRSLCNYETRFGDQPSDYKNKFYIVFWFNDDFQNSYCHDLDTYLGIIKTSICTSRKGVTYMVQRREEIGGLLFYEIIKPLHTIPASLLIRNIPFSDPDRIVVHYYNLQNDPSKYNYHDLIPTRLVLPTKFFEKLYFYLQSLPEGKFTTQNAMTMASTMASRTIVNGAYVSAPYTLTIQEIELAAYATYFLVYCRRYEFMEVLKKLKNFEDLKRNPTIWKKMCCLFYSAKNYVFSSTFEEYKAEATLKDVTDNAKAKLMNEYKTKHTMNFFQCIKRLFRIKNRYAVNFIPLTRVVTIEEDLDTIKAAASILPQVAPGKDDSEIQDIIREKLKISRVDTSVCELKENHACTSNLYEVSNRYEFACVLMCFCNRHNMSIQELRNTLLASTYYTNLFPTARIAMKNGIEGKVAEVKLFELLACEFHINICVHFETTCTTYDVKAVTTYHFKVKDNHCSELREKLPFAPFEYPMTTRAVSRESSAPLMESYSKPKADKFRMHRVVTDSYSPYVCRSMLKLHEIDSTYGVITSGNVCELSCAPGSWMQYIQLNFSQSKLFYTHYSAGLSLQYGHEDMTCLNQCTSGDLTDDNTIAEITELMERQGRMNVLLSDAAIMKSNEDVVDVERFGKYQSTFFSNVQNWLNDGGNMVFKTFSDVEFCEHTNYALNHFEKVVFCKPNFSSPISTEYYIVGLNFNAETEVAKEISYYSVPSIAHNKVIYVCQSFLKNVFPPQRHYQLPPIPSIHPISKSDDPPQVVVSIPFVEEADDPVDVCFPADTFETQIIRKLSKLELYDVVVPPSCAVVTEYSDVNPDVYIQLFDTPLISEELTDYIVYDQPMLRVDLSTVKYRSAMSNLSFIATKLATFKLRVVIDTTGLNDVETVRKIQSHVKSEFKNHELILVSQHMDCAYPIHLYEKSIIEYSAYHSSVRASNTNNYRFLYLELEHNNFQVTHSFKANVAVSTQNISILMGSNYLFRHPNCKGEYTHAYDGEAAEFVPFEKCANQPAKFFLVGDYTHLMFDPQMVEAVSKVNISALQDVQFVLVQGVAGHGKTREIVERHKPSLRMGNNGDLVVAPTKAGISVLTERTLAYHRLDVNNLDTKCYRTVTSYLLNQKTTKKFNTVYVDEAIMMHVAQVLAVAYYSGAKTVYMYGDTAQIPAHSALGDFKLRYHSPQSLFTAKAIRNKSYRIPADVAAGLDPEYRKCHSQFGQDIGVKTASVVSRSLNIVRINDVSQMKNYYNEDVKYLTFTHTTCSELNKLDSKFNPSTVAAYQGSEHPNIAIVRTSVSEADNIYNNANLCVTALTRHTKSLTYYTMCDKDDYLSKVIKYANSCSDLDIKRYSTSDMVGSISTPSDVVPTYGEGVISRFFKSRQNLTSSFTLVDHRHMVSEKEFATSLIGIKNDIFVDKSIFKKFAMSDLVKWIKKVAPNVRQVFVRVRNEPFDTNYAVIDTVEEYKCANTIMTSVSEKLVATIQPYVPDPIRLSNFIQVSPTIELVQVFMNHLFPNSVYISNQFDAYFVHTNDISYTLKDVSFSPLWDRYTPTQYAALRPVLSTPAPAVRDVSQREILLGIQKRNLNPPELTDNVCPEDVADHLLQNFGKMMVPGYTKVIHEMEPIVPTTASIVSWLERQDRSVLKLIRNDIPFILQSLSNCSLSLKRHPKIRISPTAIDVYDSVQTITCHPKFVNAYFCSVVEMAQNRLMKLMLPYFRFFTKCTTQDFGKECYEIWSKYRKLYLFSGDDSLLINGTTFKEMDMSKFDKSQLMFALSFLCKLFVRLGVPTYTAQLYYEMMYYRICSDVHNKVTMLLTPQMESGSAATYFGNTCFCAAVVLSTLDMGDFTYTPRFDKFSLMFNLEVKEFNYDNPYFCSKFVVIDENYMRFYPDPIKILIKLGRADLKNFKHLKEFHTSMKDLISQYDSILDIDMISAAIRERYQFPYDCSFLIRNLISVILDDKLFSKLFYTLPGDKLDLSSVNFGEE
ncbi:MAG: ORF1 [Kustavi negevirus]|nr:MAG: ORF1 [Kustavi negevirus]